MLCITYSFYTYLICVLTYHKDANSFRLKHRIFVHEDVCINLKYNKYNMFIYIYRETNKIWCVILLNHIINYIHIWFDIGLIQE